MERFCCMIESDLDNVIKLFAKQSRIKFEHLHQLFAARFVLLVPMAYLIQKLS